MVDSIFLYSTVTLRNETDANEKLTIPLLVAFGIYYFAVLLTGLIGNLFIIAAVFKYNHMKKVVNVFLANLALSDLLFAVLTIFDSYTLYAGEWVFGEVFCRLQGTFIEVSYTVSVLTLTAVSAERYFSICYPYGKKRTYKQSQAISAILWVLGFLFCAVLLRGYTTQAYFLTYPNDPNWHSIFKCENDNWSSKSRLTFYIIHSIFVYLIPITLMCWSHVKISKVLILPKKISAPAKNKTYPKTTCSKVKNKYNDKKHHETKVRNSKIVKLLVAVILVFFILWTPFIVLRLLKYFGVKIPNYVWRVSQLLILGTTSVNCVIYALISKPFRSAFKGLIMCQAQISSTEVELDTRKISTDVTSNRRLRSNTVSSLQDHYH